MTAGKQPSPNPGWVTLAVVTQPHGVSGRVKIKSLADPEDSIRARTMLEDASGAPVTFRVTGTAQGQYIIEVDGLRSREEAERWRGKQLGLPRAALPELPRDAQYYAADLVGLCVETEDGRAFGTVHAIQNYGAGDLLELTRPDGTRELYAFTHATFPLVDVAARRIVILPPELLGSRAEEESPEGS